MINGNDHLIDTTHPTAFPLSVYANVLILELTLPPSLQMFCLSLILSLSLSLLVSSLPLFLHYT
jgi:hypothetical protein